METRLDEGLVAVVMIKNTVEFKQTERGTRLPILRLQHENGTEEKIPLDKLDLSDELVAMRTSEVVTNCHTLCERYLDVFSELRVIKRELAKTQFELNKAKFNK